MRRRPGWSCSSRASTAQEELRHALQCTRSLANTHTRTHTHTHAHTHTHITHIHACTRSHMRTRRCWQALARKRYGTRCSASFPCPAGECTSQAHTVHSMQHKHCCTSLQVCCAQPNPSLTYAHKCCPVQALGCVCL